VIERATDEAQGTGARCRQSSSACRGRRRPQLERRSADSRPAHPADLAIEQPNEFVINAKTTKALGLTIPPSLVLRADQVSK